MRIAIVNDMLLAVEAMRRVIVSGGQHQVAWVARDGAEAVARCQQDRPELILMDLVMPNLDGVEATRRIMAESPCPILIVTANMNESPGKVFEAMGAGALDVVATPALGRGGAGEGAAKLITKIETIARVTGIGNGTATPAATGWPPRTRLREHLIALGASAGGPAALAQVLGDLAPGGLLRKPPGATLKTEGSSSGLRPSTFDASIVIVQHVDIQFAAGLAEWLRAHTALPVRLAREGDTPEAGVVLLAGLEQHLVFTSGRRLGYTRQPEDCAFQPSVDVFFESAARWWEGAVTAVLLTGMGRDGATGLQRLRALGHHTIAQDAASCAVYGMPKAAVEMGAAVEVLPLRQIGARLRRRVAPARS